MNTIEINHLIKQFGAVTVLTDINLSIAAGQFVALVGPSGCGKSTLLRTIAGLESISAGTLQIDGEVVNTKPPRERNVAMVFQSYALYPHMRVEQNMGYSMRLKKSLPQAIQSAIAGVAQIDFHREADSLEEAWKKGGPVELAGFLPLPGAPATVCPYLRAAGGEWRNATRKTACSRVVRAIGCRAGCCAIRRSRRRACSWRKSAGRR